VIDVFYAGGAFTAGIAIFSHAATMLGEFIGYLRCGLRRAVYVTSRKI
jgi:hypothetical protein